MRLLNLYVVLDKRAKTLVGPIVHEHSAVPIVRDVTEAVNKERGLIANSPSDFEILHVGMIDDETGQLHGINGDDLEQGVEVVAQAVALKARPQ